MLSWVTTRSPSTATSSSSPRASGAGAKDRAHGPVEPLERPTFGETLGDQPVNIGAPRVGAGDDVVDEVALRLVIGFVLDGRSKAMVVEFLEKARQRSALHLLLVQ